MYAAAYTLFLCRYQKQITVVCCIVSRRAGRMYRRGAELYIRAVSPCIPAGRMKYAPLVCGKYDVCVLQCLCLKTRRAGILANPALRYSCICCFVFPQPFLFFQRRVMSSSVFPFVSGTSFHTNTAAIMHIAP